jgi:hypothetical protein
MVFVSLHLKNLVMDVEKEQSWLTEFASLTNHLEVQFHHSILQVEQPQ